MLFVPVISCSPSCQLHDAKSQDFSLIAFVDDTLPSVSTFMNEVSGNTKATFITNGSNRKDAFYFSTLVSLLAFQDPFEISTDNQKEGIEGE